MFNIKRVICIIAFSLLGFLLVYLVILTKDSQKIIEVKDFIKSDIKILYVHKGKEEKYSIELFEKYSIEYMNIKINKLTVFEKNKLKNIINNNNINNIMVLFINGEIKDYLVDCKSLNRLEEFLQKNEIIPEEIVDNVNEIANNSMEVLDNEYSIIYIPYSNHDKISEQEKIFESIAKKYSIDYKKIDAYLLSKIQQNKINKLLEISDVEDQILVVVKDKKMIANIRGIHSKNTYIENLYELNFIDEIENKIKELDYEEFKNELNSSNKSIFFIGINNSHDCEKELELLNSMTYKYNLNINHINLENPNSTIYSKVKGKLEKIGYTGNFTLPLVIITESNKILDYIIGNSKEDYFLEIFIENGVIRGDEINE